MKGSTQCITAPRSTGSTSEKEAPSTAIARKLSMSRNTVDRLLRLKEPPRYERRPNGLAAGFVQPRHRRAARGRRRGAGHGHPRASPGPGLRGPHHDPQGLPQSPAPSPFAGRTFQRTSYVPARSPVRLVGRPGRHPGQKEPLPKAPRAGGDPAALGCPRDLHLHQDHGRLLPPRTNTFALWS